MSTSVEQLLIKLDDQLSHLSKSRIRGLDADDVKQELVVMVLEDVKKHPKFLDDEYEEGWWFQRLKWYMLNLKEKEHKDPINKSTRYDAINKGKK